jgi:DNA-binding MarR family transcriptional regulator
VSLSMKTLVHNDPAWYSLANRMFFRLYQCANILHKTGTRAVEDVGLTTQRWAVLGALSRPEVESGISVGDLATYLKVSRQSLSGITKRLEEDGLIDSAPDATDGRSRLFRLTEHGRQTFEHDASPLIEKFYDTAASGLSIEGMSHAIHYIMTLLENMEALDEMQRGAAPDDCD